MKKKVKNKDTVNKMQNRIEAKRKTKREEEEGMLFRILNASDTGYS